MRLFPGSALLAISLTVSAAPPPSAAAPAPTASGAQTFVAGAEAKLLALTAESDQAAWVASNFITDDTEAMAALAAERRMAAAADLAKQATRFDGLTLPAEVARKLKLLKLSLTLAGPASGPESSELARLAASMEGAYGKGKYCPPGKECLDLGALEKIMGESRDPKELLEAWKGWHAISPPLKKDYVRAVEISNKGARELGFADTGAMWRSKYDMPPDAFAREVDRLFEQVKPLYLSLHAYVRYQLRKKYGPEVVSEKGPIPAHLLGNMWAQTWGNIYPLVAPKDADPGYDLNAILKERKVDAKGMVRIGERFFTSLGFAPLPATFWERSLFTKPRDREVVCHASAWDPDQVNDLRIKMCIEPTEEDFVTIHHELGHNFYQRAYNQQPFLFRDSANDGFHEAIGDTIALSITPAYLKSLGYIGAEPPASKDVGLLMRMALEKVAFLPFGLLVDQWRWKVYAGEIPPSKYNEAWWALRQKYQGLAAPAARTESDFDAGAKYHVPASVPYTRYFLADVLQFQFHQGLSKAAGCTSPVNRCSIYDNKVAGKKLIEMLEMGLSRPWPNALEKVTGQKTMDATAVLDYFAPLKRWLDEEIRREKIPVGW